MASGISLKLSALRPQLTCVAFLPYAAWRLGTIRWGRCNSSRAMALITTSMAGPFLERLNRTTAKDVDRDSDQDIDSDGIIDLTKVPAFDAMTPRTTP